MTSALSRAEHAVRGFTRVAWVTLAGGLLAGTLILAAGALFVTASATPEDTEPSVLFTVLAPEDNGGAFEIFYPLSLLTFAIWVVAASVTLVRNVGRETPPLPPPPTVPS